MGCGGKSIPLRGYGRFFGSALLYRPFRSRLHRLGLNFTCARPRWTKAKLEIEEHGAFYSGPGEDERLWQSHELEGKYGITERFEVILEGEFEQEIDKNFEAKAIELGGQYEIVQREGDGFGLAFRTLYEFALQRRFA